MAVYIKDMKMPKRCADCELFQFEGRYDTYDNCRALKRNINQFGLEINPFEEKLPECPLREIDLKPRR